MGSREEVEIEFEILPPGPGGGKAATEVVQALQKQLSDPFSDLRRSEFAQYCADATLEVANTGGPPGAVPSTKASNRGFFDPLPTNDLHGFGGGGAAGGSDSVVHYQNEIRRLEMLLRDREAISSHAKEMWLSESSRAAKLAETLERAERKILDLEKSLSELSIMYNESSQELRQLKHLFGNSRSSDAGGPYLASPAFTPGSMPNRLGSMPNSNRTGNMLVSNKLNTTVELASTCVDDDCILFEDDLFQIGLKAHYHGLDAEIALFFGNKSSKFNFHNFSTDYTVKQDNLLKLSMSTMAPIVESGAQECQRVTATCLGAFIDAPVLRVAFLLSDNSPRRIQVKLPVTVAKFLEPIDLPASDYFNVWRDHDYSANEQCTVVDIAKRYQEAANLAPLAKTVCLGDVLKLLPGIDSNPDNLVLSGRFQSDGSLILCRVEVGSGSFRGKARIACRSNDPKLAKGICQVLQSQIGMSHSNDAA